MKILILLLLILNLDASELKKALYENYLQKNRIFTETKDFGLYPSMSRGENGDSIFSDTNDTAHYNKKNIDSIFHQFNLSEENYIVALENQNIFSGIYLTGGFERYLNKFENIGNEFYLGSQNRYMAGIRWDIFDKGYFKSKKDLKKKVLETKLENLQLKSQFINHALNNRIFKSKLYLNEIAYEFHTRMLSIYKEIYSKRVKMMKRGYIDLEEVQEIEMKKAFHKSYIDHYRRQERAKMDQDLFRFVNNIEKVVLINKKIFIEKIKSDSIDMKTQDIFKERADLFPEYIDNVRAYVYVKHEFRDYYGDQESIGFAVDLPLDRSSERDKLVRLQQKRYQLNQEAIKVRIEQKATYLYQHFSYINARIKSLISQLHFLIQQRANLDKKIKAKLTKKAENLTRKIDMNRLDITRLRDEIIKAKMENYINFLNICQLINFENINEIIKVDKR
ncbi:hypothetical protein MNB_SV-6-1176 [hydrothermal vent metagenome]|uniref:Uncharacterized protein n=1 Tax=hydrothermal vent metagenome TaxID=652676 RepID=A0A1W1C9M2_9ZZZZ